MKPLRYILLASLLVVVPFLLTRRSPEAKAANRIRDAYLAAERPVLRPDSGEREIENFLGELKAIDTSAAPEEVEKAMVWITIAVESNLAVRRAGGDTNAANEKVAAAKKDLIRALERWRGEPF